MKIYFYSEHFHLVDTSQGIKTLHHDFLGSSITEISCRKMLWQERKADEQWNSCWWRFILKFVENKNFVIYILYVQIFGIKYLLIERHLEFVNHDKLNKKLD